MDDWLNSPRFRRQRVVVFGLLTLLFLISVLRWRHPETADTHTALVSPIGPNDARIGPSASYDGTYPLRRSSVRGQYVIGVIADMDQKSSLGNTSNKWRSLYKEAKLIRNSASGKFSIEWTRELEVRSGLANGGRGMELSALTVFNGELLTCDDRTGVVYSLHETESNAKELLAIPHHILQEGDGQTAKNLKCEWMAVRSGHLFVGGFGKEFVDDKTGAITSEGPMWVKVLDHEGRLTHVDWRPNYRVLRKATDTEHPAYLLHEAAAWHEGHQRWYFLPRRVSHEPYDEVKDELRGSNLMLSVGPDFGAATVESRTIGEVFPPRGFSCFKFVPDAPNEIVALKSVELLGVAETFIMAYNIKTGEVLLPETRFADVKFEGIEFIEG